MYFTLKDTQKNKKRRNYIEIREFILLGLSDDPKLHILSCVFLLTTYMLSITGNLTISTLTLLDAHLQSLMYFFLRKKKLSSTTVTIPKFLATIIIGDKTFYFTDCMANFFFILLGVTEFCLLAAKSYDHYIIICKQLHYMTMMNHRVCTLLVLVSWLASSLIIFSSLMLFRQLDYAIYHFTCDYFPFYTFLVQTPNC